MAKALNRSLVAARAEKRDEFYTQLADIERELKHYKAKFKGKVIYCNCDDPNESNFVKYFKLNFEYLGLKKLIATHFKDADLLTQAVPYKLEYTGNGGKGNEPNEKNVKIEPLEGDGDFRGKESLTLLKQADIVITNPPFSLFRDYVEQLMEHKKRFIIIGSMNAITYKEIFPLVRDNKVWLGYGFAGGNAYFRVANEEGDRFANGVFNPDTGLVKFRNVNWFTNLDHSKRHETLTLYKQYNPKDFPTYDNYDAINVDKVADIPDDYEGAMGVPITFLDKYNPKQFEILGITDRDDNSGLKTQVYSRTELPNAGDLNRRGAIKMGKVYKSTYARLFIRRRKV